MDVLIKIRGQVAMDLGSVNAPPPLEHRDSGVAGPVLWCLGYLLPSAPKDRLLRAGGKKTSPEWKVSSFKQFRIILN